MYASQTYSKETVAAVQEALTQAQKSGKLSTSIFEVRSAAYATLLPYLLCTL